MSAEPRAVARGIGPIHVALLALSFGAGATDAFAFLSLKGIFTANMTGNLILIGLFDRADYSDTLIGASVALAAFTIALVLGFRYIRLAREKTFDQGRALAVMGVIVTLQIAVFAFWLIVGNSPGIGLRSPLIAMSSVAMALQTVAARGVAADTGLSTTYVTGTITSLIQDIVDGKRENRALRLGAVLTLVAGAFAGAVCIHFSERIGPLVPVLAALLAFALMRGALMRGALIGNRR